jgi:hypothetical protein
MGWLMPRPARLRGRTARISIRRRFTTGQP